MTVWPGLMALTTAAVLPDWLMVTWVLLMRFLCSDEVVFCGGLLLYGVYRWTDKHGPIRNYFQIAFICCWRMDRLPFDNLIQKLASWLNLALF
jgi:hypothetical protein